MRAFVLINIRTGEVGQVLRQLRGLPGVVEASMTFGPYDAIAIVEGDNLNALGTMLSSRIQPIPGITQTLTCLAVEA
ncbi:MAG TPA: Lrp/AsnC ligand binding domain-containing protein [Anaerolineales bacterium]|nr:Lrp/AsnC ligand binding domain-containing protein [Anaerolineales bacterium]